MTQKRFIKLLMGKGFSRNEANILAGMRSRHISYSLMWDNWYRDINYTDTKWFTFLMDGVIRATRSMDT